MKYLLDTHIFLWYIESSSKLSAEYKSLIEDISNEIYLSVVAVWELIIKATLGKFKCNSPILDFTIDNCRVHGIKILDLDYHDLSKLENLPLLHKDPFDRILIAQSKNRNMIFLTDDVFVKKYQGN